MKKNNNEPLTLDDYQKLYGKKDNIRNAKNVIAIAMTVLGLVVATCLFFIVMKIFEMDKYAGYVSIAIAVLVFIFLFLVPVIKVCRSGYFEVNVNERTARGAQKHNRALRKDIAKKIVDFTGKVSETDWYDEKTVGKLAIALQNNNDKEIKENLSSLYKGSIKKAGQAIIVKSSIKCGTYSALSQSATLDTALVSVTNIKMIKDLVFLYGFRPSDAKFAKICKSVIIDSFIAFGVANANLGGAIAKGISATKNIPFLGTLLDSAAQGITNGILSSVIGYQTISYLQKEYRLQDVLDGIELTNEEELKEICEETKKGIIVPAKPKAAGAN